MPKWVSSMNISDEVKNALDAGEPVLALESTIITHGMPYPENLETALLVEKTCRDEGAIPATIAILDGRIKVGLSPTELTTLAGKDVNVVKASRRDLPFIVAGGLNGGTTVAATMISAARAGICVFATGGIGGVHRGAQQSMDISADLEELSKTDVTVVCAGPKSILDIGLTLEYLETKGVAVVGYKTDELPAFFSTNSAYKVDYRIDSAEQIAAVLNAKHSLGLHGGMLIARPIEPQFALDSESVNRYIEQAEAEASELGISGKEITPYLLQRINELSDGESLKANVQLVLGNVRLGAQIAIASSNLKRKTALVKEKLSLIAIRGRMMLSCCCWHWPVPKNSTSWVLRRWPETCLYRLHSVMHAWSANWPGAPTFRFSPVATDPWFANW
jgi:pseudouridine-5'-phosphate glycosidase